MNATLQTPLCGLLGCDYPVVLAGMGGVARSALVAAVSEAGGFGFLGMVREAPTLIRDEIRQVRAATTRDFGINLIPAATKPALLEAELEVVLAERVAAVTLFWDIRRDIIARLRAAGCLVLCQIGSLAEAQDAIAAGAHILIAQGVEAGGHIRGEQPLATLLREVTDHVSIPVLAAGGIIDGKGLAAVLGLGAQGAVVGTGFLATRESFAHDYHKDRIVAARADETLLTEAFHISWPKGAKVRVLPNSVTRGERGDPFAGGERRRIGEELGRPVYLFSTESPLRDMTGDFEAMAIYAGAGAGAIDRVPSAAERLGAIVEEAARILGNGAGATEDAINAPSSPACSMHEADDAYMGYAGRVELVAFLNELLEAERAGARVTLRTALAAQDDGIVALMHAIQRDEAKWCAMLLRHLKALGETPSPKVGAFYGKAMAIEETAARIAFLNRGQGWVVRKLREMLPRVRDDGLHAELAEMLRSHEANIARATLPAAPDVSA